MSKKKRPASVNNINQLNLEIDYDKLAEAMVKAQEKLANREEKAKTKKTRFRNALLSNANGIIYIGIALFMVIIIGSIWVHYSQGTGLTLVRSIIISILLAFFAVVSFMCSQETFTDNYETTVSLFNTNVSLIALIVAIIALFKDLG